MSFRKPVDLTVTAREVQILQLIAEGQSNAKIGAVLDLSPLTVKSHLTRMAPKLGTRNRAGMVGAAFRRGLIR